MIESGSPVAVRQVVMVPVSEIREAPYNPIRRIGERALEKLFKSIEKRGIVVPLLLASDGTLIDGHRRLACARRLDYVVVPAIYADSSAGDDPQEIVYDELASSTRPLRQSDRMEIYSRGGQVAHDVLIEIQALENLVGVDEVKRFAALGVSPDIVREVRTLTRYCGREDYGFMRQATLWMVNTRQRWNVRRAMAVLTPPQTIENAVLNNRMIEWQVSVRG